MADTLSLNGDSLKLDDVGRVAFDPDIRVELAPAAVEAVQRSRAAVDELLRRGEVAYGITTGFGAFARTLIAPEQAAALQRNILVSHATGVGPPLDEAAVRATMLIRANSLAKGLSGIRRETLERLLAMLNAGVHPVIPAQGSLGASGDLAPLAHMALPLIGEGEAVFRGERLPGAEAMRRAGLELLELGAKEGLALTNGTAPMSAVGALATLAAENAAHAADIVGGLTLEALEGTVEAYDARLQAARPHPRAVECADYLRRLVEGSELLRGHDPHRIQDAYTLRCIPQVHGAVRDAIAYDRWLLEIEINSATDNPLVMWEGDEPVALSGGNFHGQPVSIAMDYLALALVDLGNMSERRINRLINENVNDGLLPPFLIKHGGLNSGFMLAHCTAASLTSENKVLAHPASADTLPTSADVEDHVSMGMTAARQAAAVLRNVELILGIELFAAAQAIDFRQERAVGQAASLPEETERRAASPPHPLRLGRGTAPAYALVRERIPFLEQDTVMYPYIEAARALVASGELVQACEEALGVVRVS
jgi:histidine ammonia-lyase